MSEYIELGSISGFFGVQGWVKLHSLTRPRESIESYNSFYTENNDSIEFTKIKKSGKNVIGYIKGIDTREKAEKYIGRKLYLKQEDLPVLDNEFYWNELIGLSVTSTDGDYFGVVDSLIETGVNDVLIIKNQDQEILIPFVMNHFILSVDLDANQMIVDWERVED